MKRFIFCFLLIAAAYILQIAVFPFLQIAGIRPNLMIMITSMVGFMMGSRTGLLTGFFSGLLVDIMAGGNVGFSALAYMYIGSINGLFYKDYVKEELFIPLALVSVGTFFYEFLYYIFYFVLQNKLNVGFYITRVVLPETIYTAVVTLLVYVFLYYIIRKVEQEKKRRNTTVVK